MKKLILPIVILLLIGASIYAVYSYNNAANNDQQTKEEPSSNETANEEATGDEEAAQEDTSTNSDTNSPQNDKVLAWDFTFENLKGEEVTLSDFRGKKVFLNFWASWCGPCRLEMPDIETLHKELNPEEAVIIAVNIGEDRSTVSKFLRDNSFTFPTALDPLSTAPSRYELQGIPTTFIIDEEGYIDSKYSGYMTLSQMREAMGL
ncbi:TlpA family protein disulfide reductase [Alloiococcus sp. CFN-8]|uniref:TlpA family protein disulfide reductase n=1 Tax=Alloiococcus sp. CFN-8 TaxID=3416081 RepID=UPI003CF662EE